MDIGEKTRKLENDSRRSKTQIRRISERKLEQRGGREK